MTRYFSVVLGVVDGRPCVRADGSGTIAGHPFHLDRYDDGSWTALYDPYAVPPELSGLGAALGDHAALFGLPYQMPTPRKAPSPWRGRLLTLVTTLCVVGFLCFQVLALFTSEPSLTAALAPVVLPIIALLHTRRRQRLTILSWLALAQVPVVLLADIGTVLWLVGRLPRAEPWMGPSGIRLLIVAAAALAFLYAVSWL